MIKNSHIIHMLTEVGRYWCVGAVDPTPLRVLLSGVRLRVRIVVGIVL